MATNKKRGRPKESPEKKQQRHDVKYVNGRKCTRCRKTLPIDQFYPNLPECIECNKERSKRYQVVTRYRERGARELDAEIANLRRRLKRYQWARTQISEDDE